MSNDITTPVNVSKAFVDRPDTDSSSMRGYYPGSAEFQAATPPAAAAPAAAAPKAYDVDSSSMRGFTSGGPVVTP